PERTKLSPIVLAGGVEFGKANGFVHIWAYQSMDQRMQVRDEARKKGVWPPPGGGDRLISQQNKIVLPAAFSPLPQGAARRRRRRLLRSSSTKGRGTMTTRGKVVLTAFAAVLLLLPLVAVADDATLGIEHWVQSVSGADGKPLKLNVWEKRSKSADPAGFATS